MISLLIHLFTSTAENKTALTIKARINNRPFFLSHKGEITSRSGASRRVNQSSCADLLGLNWPFLAFFCRENVNLFAFKLLIVSLQMPFSFCFLSLSRDDRPKPTKGHLSPDQKPISVYVSVWLLWHVFQIWGHYLC